MTVDEVLESLSPEFTQYGQNTTGFGTANGEGVLTVAMDCRWLLSS